MSDSQILQQRASRLAAEAYREKIDRLEAELAAAKERETELHAWLSAPPPDHPGSHSKAVEIAKWCHDVSKNAHREAIEAAAQVAANVYPRGSAHTYASENADRYRAQEETCEIIAARIRALIEETPAT